MLSAIALCSTALGQLGANTISSFDDGSYEAEVASAIYAPCRDGLLSLHPWSFATGQVVLPKLTATPVADFDYAYQLPSNFLRALSVGYGDGTSGRGLDYRILERRIFANGGDNIILNHIFRPDESAWPPFFDQALIARLAAEFCIPITDSTTRSDLLFRRAEVEFSRAKMVDGQQQSPGGFQEFPLIDVREEG